jgi:stage V sporulation protein B
MFKQDSVDRAAPWLSVASVSIVFLGVISVTNAFLNSAGKQNLPIVSMICGAATKLIANSILIERIGIVGAPLATLMCYIVASLVNVYFVIKHIGRLPDVFSVFIRPFICTVISVGGAAVFYLCFSSLIYDKICTVLSIIMASALYGVSVIKSKTVTEEEISALPFGNKVVNVLKKINLLSK